MKKQLKKKEEALHLNKNYKDFLHRIKDRLKTAQIRAALAANSELIKFYWQLGTDLLEKQKAYKWGDHFLEQFSHDMRQAFPEMQGFSVRNLQRMKQFATLYPDLSITTQAVSQLPWGHITRLIQMVKNELKREWYAQQTIKNGWSRTILEMQIESGLFERQGVSAKKTSNYHQHLPAIQSGLANEVLKDPYNFDFLTIQEPAHERAVENGLVAHIRDFLLELGQGFAFVGSQVPLTFEDQEFFVDLLFYHLNLRAFVVIELKATKFKPEHTGQLGFYLAAVDDLLRKEGDNRTIGILLCKSKNKVIAEYALRNVKAPIGVSEYTLSKALPKELKSSLPTVKEIEAELNEISVPGTLSCGVRRVDRFPEFVG
jgi:predicted nuclease of restriction endonuclease-like (RecB) superfamily